MVLFQASQNFCASSDCIMKQCSKCHEMKELPEFYRKRDGHESMCKDCRKEATRIRRGTPEGKAIRSAYGKKIYSIQKDTQSALEDLARRVLSQEDKYRVYSVLENALLSGEIRRLPCEICGHVNTEAIHDDYSKPLNVRWRCFTHFRDFSLTKVGSDIILNIPDDASLEKTRSLMKRLQEETQ